MQHDMASITCPACQCSISVQQIAQLHEKHQEAKRRQQLCESQRTILVAWRILDQGREADLQGDLARAFQLYKEGLARALHVLKLWPATNPIVPMMDHFHSQTMWAMRRSEKISKALAAWAAVSEHPPPMEHQAFQHVAQLSAAAAAQAGAPSSGPRHSNMGVALGTTQGEKPPQLQPLQPAQLPQPMHLEMRQLKQVTQQQAQQPQKVAQQQAQHQVAQEPQQQHRQPEVVDLVTVAGQQEQQQQQQLKKQQQQPEHQHLQEQELGALRTPRPPLAPPPDRLLKAKSKAVSDANATAAKMPRWKKVGPQCVASGDAHQKQRATMQDEKKEDHKEFDVDFLMSFTRSDDERAKLELLRD